MVLGAIHAVMNKTDFCLAGPYFLMEELDSRQQYGSVGVV